MPTRTIYTTSEVHIGDTGTVLQAPHIVSAVTSATFTKDTPREQVTVFGKKGQVATVQNESTTSTIEIVFHPYQSTSGLEGPDPSESGNFFEPTDLNSLMADSAKDTPTGETILVKGVGKLTNALLTSITAEGSVGALPTITLAFDGRGSVDSSAVTADTASYSIANMTNVNLYAGSGNTSAYAQSATFNWEMPIEKLNKLGDSVESAWTYGTPPGTASIAVEGTDDAGKITSVNFGLWRLSLDSDAEVSNTTNNMAVGELGATYNTTTEGVADGCVCAVNT
tara:strand:- start:79814 stop:80659 length:846 start_codon:yes stop_codon:yes gene_type:complete